MSKERKKPDEQLNDVDIENQSGDNIVICREALLFTHDHLGVPHDIDRGHDDDEEGNDVEQQMRGPDPRENDERPNSNGHCSSDSEQPIELHLGAAGEQSETSDHGTGE